MTCGESVLTAIPTPSQSSDEDVRLFVDVPSTLDKVTVCLWLPVVMTMMIMMNLIMTVIIMRAVQSDD